MTNEKILQLIRDAIKADGRSYSEIARVADVSDMGVGNLVRENGNSMRVDTAVALCEAVGLELVVWKKAE